jgi:Lon protease-like protein
LAHIVVQPVQGDNPGVASFVANYGCLAHIESVSSQESEPGLVLLTVLIVAACCKLHTTVNTWYT